MNKIKPLPLRQLLLVVTLSLMPFLPVTIHAMPKPDVGVGTNADWVEVEVAGFDKVRLTKSVDLSQFQNFLVQEPTLEFDKNWLREFASDMTERDEQRIRESYTQALREALEQSLGEELGWPKADQAGPKTLVVIPALSRLRITAPDLSFRGATKDYVQHTGAARLVLTLQNGSNSATLLELSDYSETRWYGGPGDLKPTNRGENLRDFRNLSKRWADRFGEYLAGFSRS